MKKPKQPQDNGESKETVWNELKLPKQLLTNSHYFYAQTD